MRKIFLSLLLLLGIGATLTAVACSGNEEQHTEHNFEFAEVVIEPTCTEVGSAKYVCSDCGAVMERPMSPIWHNWGEWTVETPATCKDKGEEVRTCKNDASHKTTRSIDALGHDWGEWEEETPATCDIGGEKVRVCKHDATHKESRATDPIGHDWGEWETDIPATCYSYGYDVHVCKNNPSHKESRPVDPLDHDWGEWEEETPATCLEDGEEVRTCKNDFLHEETRTVKALGHTSALHNWSTLYASTCIISGTDALLCDRCGDVLETRRVAVLAHEYSNGVCSDCGRRDWSVAQIDDPDLYNSEYGLRMLADEENGGAMQALYLLIDGDARVYHNGNSDSVILGVYDYMALGLTMDEAVAVWKTYMDDHPLYYWLSRTMSYGEVAAVLVDGAYSSHTVRQLINQTIYKKASEWREDTEENAYLAALSFHDKIIFEVNYLDSNRIYPEGTSWAHNIVGVFEGRGAVCEGYARSFQLLLNMTGIENVFVTGKSGNIAHAWNMVKLDDGKWYWFDLTYDDIPGWMWGVRYNYFAVSEEQNIGWSDSGLIKVEPRYFASEHTPDSGTDVNLLVRLPETAKVPYEGVGELRLRQTFTVDEFTYAVAGYHTVQLIECTATGDVHIPETVEYQGITYGVISIGAMDEDGIFDDSLLNVYHKPIETLFIPSSIRFLWTNAVHNTYKGGIVAFEVAEDNDQFTSLDGVIFTKDLYTLISYPGKSLKAEYRIPDGVEIIAYHAFMDGGENLRSLILGKDLSSAGNTNWGNGWLRSDNTGSHSFVTGEWGSTFIALKVLETLSVDPESENFTVFNDVLYNKDMTILYSALYSVEELVVPASVERIRYDACRNYYIKKVIFEGNAIKNIQSGAFSNCFSLSEIVFNGTQEEWDAVDKEGLKDCNYTLTCTKE